jgi:hypothetical protein
MFNVFAEYYFIFNFQHWQKSKQKYYLINLSKIKHNQRKSHFTTLFKNISRN